MKNEKFNHSFKTDKHCNAEQVRTVKSCDKSRVVLQLLQALHCTLQNTNSCEKLAQKWSRVLFFGVA